MKMRRTHFEEFQASYGAGGYNALEHYAECMKTIRAVRKDPRYQEANPHVDVNSPILTSKEADTFLALGPLNRFTAFYRSLESDPGQSMTTFREWSAMYNFWASGCRIFQVATDLSRMLVETDLKVEQRFLKLPFPALFISWEGLDLSITCSIDESNWPLAGAYIYEITEPDHDGVVRRMWRFFFVTKEDLDEGGNVLFSTLSMSDDPHLLITDDSIVAHVCGRPNFADTFEHNVKEHEWGRFTREMPPLVRLAVNSILYINAPGSDLNDCEPDNRDITNQLARMKNTNKGKNKKRKRKLEDELAKRTTLPWVRVGAGVRAATRRAAVESTDGGVSRLTYRFTVRGHWRTYWKSQESMTEAEWAKADKDHTRESRAKNEDKRKKLYALLKWIEPFEKGPEFAEVVTKRYVVE